uniref:Adhesion G protein-coupled receptor G4 n=1 Tax=Nannospalax galili TaxID=1026970 RepID=A0A8C6RF77_NANGA
MKQHMMYQRLYGLILVSSFIFLSDTLSLKGKRLDFHGEGDTRVSLTNVIPELSRLTACIDLISMGHSSSYWMAFSYITNNTLLGREDIDLGIAGDHQQLILYSLGKTFDISYQLIPFQWHTVCLTWDGVKGRLELFLNKERILAIMDQPHNLSANGTLVLGCLPKNGEGQIKSVISCFTGSLYYFQLWDHILKNEEFMTCLHGNVVSWEEDVWIIHKIIPTVDRRLRCFVSENMTIQETSTTVSQQIDLTTPSHIAGLNPQKTVHSSTTMPKSTPVFAANHTTIWYSNTMSSPLATMSASKYLKTSIAETATFAADGLFTSATIPLPTHSTPIRTTNHPYSKKTRTSKMVETVATETFHPTTATNFFATSGITKNSIVSETLAIKSQPTVMKIAPFSVNDSTSVSTTSCHKHKSPDVAGLPTSKSKQESLVSSTARTVSGSTVEEILALTTDIGTMPAFPPQPLLIPTVTPVDSVLPENQMASSLPTTDKKMVFTVHSVLPVETTPAPRTVKTELVHTDFQDVSSLSMDNAIFTSMPKETSSMALYSMTSSPIAGTQSKQTVIDIESTHPALTPGITLHPTLAEDSLFPTIEGLEYTQNTPTADEPMLTLISTKSPSTSKASESGPTSLTDETAYQLSTNDTTWTSRPDQTLLTSMNTTTFLTFMPNENLTSVHQGNATNVDHMFMTTNTTPLETFTKRKATISSDGSTARYTEALFRSTSLLFGNFSSVSEIPSITNQPEFELTTLLLKSIPMSTVAANVLPTVPRETFVPSVDISTLADVTRNFSTQESSSETTQTETNGTSTFGDTMAPLSKSVTTQLSYTTVMRKETTSDHPKGKSTIAAVTGVSPFSAMLEATNESAQMVTASITVSPFPDIEKSATALNNKTATTGVGMNWLSTKLTKTTPKSSYNGTTEIFKSTHWHSETSEGTLVSLSTSVSTETFPEQSASGTRIWGATFSMTPTQKTAMSLSTGVLPPKTAAIHSSTTPQPITYMSSLPVNVSVATYPVTYMVVSDETKVTLPQSSTLARDFSPSVSSGIPTLPAATMPMALVLPLSPTPSTTSTTMSTHRGLFHTISEVPVTSSTKALREVPSVRETLASSPRTASPMITKTITTFPSTSTDIVSPFVHTLVCSKPPPDKVTIVSSTHVSPTTSTLVTSTHVLTFPYTFSRGRDVSMVTYPTETSADSETLPPNTSANKFTTPLNTHISQSSTYFVNTSVTNQLVTDTSVLPPEKEQMNTSIGKTSITTSRTEISPKNSLISSSQSTSLLEITDTEFSETTEISSHQTYLPSETPPGNAPSGNLAASPIGRTQTTQSLTSSSIQGIHTSEIFISLEKTAVPSQVQTITTFLSPDKENASAISESTPWTVGMIASSSFVTNPVSSHQDTSSIDTTTSRTTRPSHPVLIKTTLSHLLSLKCQPKATWVASSTSESTQAFTNGPLNANFTMISPDGITTAFSLSKVPTTFPMETSIPLYQISSLPVNVTAFTSKKVSDILTTPMRKSSETIHPDCSKNVSIGTSGPMPEKFSMPENNSHSSNIAVSSDTSTRIGLLSTLLSSTTPKTTKTAQTSSDITPVAYPGPTSQSMIISSAFTNSEEVEESSKITTIPISSPTESAFPTTITEGTVISVTDTSASSLLSSKNTEAISSIPMTVLSSLLLPNQQSSQEGEAITLGILPGITNSSTDRRTELVNTYSRTTIPEIVLSTIPSDSLHASSDIRVSPSNFMDTPRPIKSVKSTTTHLSFNTRKTTSFELTKKSTSVTTPVLYPLWTPNSATQPSFTSRFYLPHSSEAKFSTPKISTPRTSQMVEFPVWGTRITPNISQSLLIPSWNTPKVGDSQFPTYTTTHVMTSNKMVAETLNSTSESLSIATTNQTSMVSKDIAAMSLISTSEILPTFGLSENTSLSISSGVFTTTSADVERTFEKTATSITPGTIFSSNPIISNATSPFLPWIVSSLPSGSLATLSNPPRVLTSSSREMVESTFPASDLTPTYPFANFTLPFASGSTILTNIVPVPTLGIITSGSLNSLPIFTKTTDDSVPISMSLEASPRTTVTDNSRTVSEPMSFSIKSLSPSITGRTLSIGSLSLSSPTKTSAWSTVPATSASPTLIPPKLTLDSLINVAITTPTSTGSSFPLMSAAMTHPSTTVSSLISTSFETTWMNSTTSFIFAQESASSVTSQSAVSFYSIAMNFSVFDEEPRVLITSVINEFANKWLNSIFQNCEFSLANMAIQIKSRYVNNTFCGLKGNLGYSGYACWVIIKANSSLTSVELISRIRNKIHGNLTHGNFTQDQLTLLVKSDQVVVKKLEPGKCNMDETPSKYKGTYKWLLTDPTETAQTRCIKNERENATRICSVSIQTGKSQWDKPRFKKCKLLQELPNKIVDLANITISDENADDVAEHILNLVNDSPPLDEEETKIIVSKVADISKCDEISVDLTKIILQIISGVTEKQNDSASNLPQVCNEILRIIERAGYKMEFVGTTANFTVARLALAVLQVDHRFEGMAFSIGSSEELTDPEIFLGDIPVGRVLASIYLPTSLSEKIPLNGLQTILFNFFGQTSLFKAQNTTTALTTYVVSASISNTSIQNLADPVVIILKHIQGNWNYDQVYCAFWDFDTNNGLGGWNSSGCKVKETNVNYTICQCNHLTHFGVLMDLSRSTVDAVNERILVIITYTGCGISSIFLGIAMVTYILWEVFYTPPKIYVGVNALLEINQLSFATVHEIGFVKPVSVLTSCLAVLTELIWLLTGQSSQNAPLVCFPTAGIPAITVAMILSVRKDLYGTLSPTTPFCWIKDDPIFYISVVAYFCLIFLTNLSMFCTVLVQLNSVKSQSQKTRRKMILSDLKGIISLTFLLGLTWGFAFFAWGPVRLFFMYLFAICNTLQGFLIFVFYCVMKESVREQWYIHLHCRWLQLDNSSGKMPINVRYKRESRKKTHGRKLLMPSLKSTTTNSSFRSLGSAPGTPSKTIFPNDTFDENHYTLSSVSCETIPNFIRRTLPAEIKTNSIKKQRPFSLNVNKEAQLPPSPGLGKMLNL